MPRLEAASSNAAGPGTGAPSAHPPDITVVIPTYQRADTLERAISSVLAQEGPTVEVVVVDDGSTDGTEQLLAGITDSRVRVLRQENRGRGAARNAGASVARGATLTFLDSDDEMLPSTLAEFARLIDADSHPLVRLAARQHMDGSDTTLGPGTIDPACAYPRGTCAAGTYALTTRLFRGVGGFDPALPFAENTELMIRIALAARREGWSAATSDHEAIVWYRSETPERTDRYDAAPRRAAEVVLRRYADELRRAPAVLRDYRAIIGTHELRSGHRGRALLWFVRSWMAVPTDRRAAARIPAVLLPPALRTRLAMRAR